MPENRRRRYSSTSDAWVSYIAAMDKGAPGTTEGMKGGGFYDAHSEYQRRIVAAGTAAIMQSVDALDLASINDACTIADYGCGTGATSVQSVGAAVRRLRERSRDLPLHTIHADLLTNDFNQVFRNVAETYAGTPGGPIYCSAVGGSFFEQILPSRSVHFGMCSNAAHWFRVQPQVDVPEGMYFSDACGAAREKLARQAADDWLAFLRARASEIVPGGRMLVQGIATVHDADGSEKVSAAALLQLMWQIANTMVEDSLLDRAILGRYLFPVYCRSKEEATAPVNIGGLLARDFGIVSAEISETGNPYWEQFEQSGDPAGYARSYTAFVRAFAESTLMKNLFASSGKSSELCDEFFSRFESAIRQDPSRGKYEAWVLRLILARR